MLCCFTAAYPAQPGGTLTTVLYGQIICNIKALMTWNYSCINYRIANVLTKAEDSDAWLNTPWISDVCVKRLLLCHFLALLDWFSTSTDTMTPTDDTSEMKCCDADEAMSGKRTYLNMPETMSNPQILRH